MPSVAEALAAENAANASTAMALRPNVFRVRFILDSFVAVLPAAAAESESRRPGADSFPIPWHAQHRACHRRAS